MAGDGRLFEEVCRGSADTRRPGGNETRTARRRTLTRYDAVLPLTRELYQTWTSPLIKKSPRVKGHRNRNRDRSA